MSSIEDIHNEIITKNPDFSIYLKEFSEELTEIGQNQTLSTDSFADFTRERGVKVDYKFINLLYEKKLIGCDWINVRYKNTPYFHPFRFYILYRMLNEYKFSTYFNSFIEKDNILSQVEKRHDMSPDIEQMEKVSMIATKIIDLAILLEPIYWPKIIECRTYRYNWNDNEFRKRYSEYKDKISKIVEQLDIVLWEKIHAILRFQAYTIDKNDDLYVLLRVSGWDRIKELAGNISGALWVRFIAETIRLAFEESHKTKWFEEDIYGNTWNAENRKLVFGAERPFDHPLKTKSYISKYYNLFTGSFIRWYVEGYTEYHAINTILCHPHISGIEIINLRGNVKQDKDNIALKLKDCLQEDIGLKRFSFIMFDEDVPENIKAIIKQIKDGNIVGSICLNVPDFEFANFTIKELVDIAADIDDKRGYNGDLIRNANWNGVKTGKSFEKHYEKISQTKQSIKGEHWGKSLANYAIKNEIHPETGEQRQIYKEITAVLRSRSVNYDYQRDNFIFEPNKPFTCVQIESSNTNEQL